METVEKLETSEWKRPDEVMQLHRIKVKKRALQARMNNICIDKGSSDLEATKELFKCNQDSSPCVAEKRKNPFAKDLMNKRRNIVSTDLEASNDNTLFELFKIEAPNGDVIEDPLIDCSLTFTNAISKLESVKSIPETEPAKGEKYIPIDWTLKTKMRFMSIKPFPWNCKLRTSEEASGITGFVRCMDISEQDSTLDTSPNAR